MTNILRTVVVLALMMVESRFVRAAEVDVRPLEIQVEQAFPQIAWEGWTIDSGDEDDLPPYPLRPLLITHAGDNSGRIFVVEEHGVIYVIPPGDDPRRAKRFLDIATLISYNAIENEEGLLGLAFHPQFAQNGEFFVFYTNKHTPHHQNILARYHVSKENPSVADPQSREVLMTFDKPYWNHDGGTIIFGPDGCLYIAIGDGGMMDDPHGHGQRLDVPFGKILRIDVDHKDGELPYAIPHDNPFVGKPNARGEVWALGLRNVWRMAFDRKTGALWAADVGQDTWEEIDLIVKGGNYGWNLREGLHKFPKAKQDVREGMIDPIFEYDHRLGKSITGGFVYRGEQIPQLKGGYLYADYVICRMWALWYDDATKQVTANREIRLPHKIAVMSFGEDQDGNPYFMTDSRKGTGIYRLAPEKVSYLSAKGK